MKIVACLAWYDESPEFLDRCVRSLAGVADTLVAFEGPWALMPRTNNERDKATKQIEVVRDAAFDIGIDPHVITGEWSTQVTKRDGLMRYASLDDGGWLFVIDADEYIDYCDPRSLRQTLATTTRDVATITCKRTTGCESVNIPAPIRRLFRAPVTVERGHNGYRSSSGAWLNGDSAYVKLARAVDATDSLTLHHEYLNRSPERNEARKQYRMARRRDARIESWV